MARLDATARDYVCRMCSECQGMKVLVLDAVTTKIVSMVYTQSQILQHEVFLIDNIHNPKPEKMPHLKAVYFVRPTAENVRLLQQELRDPKYGEYRLFFSNLTRDGMIQQLAEADEHEVVQQVNDLFADYLAVTPELFELSVPSVAGLSGPVWDQPVFDRIHQGVCSLLLSLKKRPTIRYQRSSEMCQRVAETIIGAMEAEVDLYSFRRPETPPLLLLLDRRDDPVTPLLSQWTYQAMTHELIGISDNRVDLRGAPGVPRELEQIVLSVEHDPFFADNMLKNYGDLAENVQRLLEDFQKKTHSSKTISSIADMQNFVEQFPQFKKMSADVTKHVTLLGEINRLVEAGSLMEVSQVEQELACTEDHATAASEVDAMLSKPAIPRAAKLRVLLLYALRYERESSNRIAQFANALGADAPAVVATFLRHCGASVRSGDLFGNKSWLAATRQNLKRTLKGGVQNVYTQHSPFLANQLDQLLKGTLSESTYAYMGPEPPQASSGKRKVPTDIIVFVIGGATFEEARYVQEMNVANPGVRVLLGGTCIHNSTSFVDEILDLERAGTAPARAAATAAVDPLASGMAAMGLSPPNIDRKRISALTSSTFSSVTSSMQSGLSAVQSKLQ